MHNQFLGKSVVASLFAGLMLTLSAAPAPARTVAGIAGHVTLGTDPSCAGENYGAMTNVCSGRSVWVVPLPIDAGGSYSGRIRVTVPPGQRIQCNVYGLNEDVTSVWAPPWTYNTVDGTSSISPGTTFVPAWGHLMSACYMDSNTRVNNVVY